MWNPLKWSPKRLQIVVIAGVLLGISAPIGAMMFSSHKSEAAVAVIDEKNIAEAIKTAIQTANILTEEQKQLALMILDAKKLDMSMLEKWTGSLETGGGCFGTSGKTEPIEILKSLGKSPAALNQNAKAVDIFKSEIGTIEDAMTGKKTLYDLYVQTQKNHKALDATYKASVERAQASGEVTKNTQEVTKEAMEAAKHAEGEQQLMQASIQILGAQALQGADLNDLMAHYLAMQSEKWYGENVEKAAQETRDRAIAQNFMTFAGTAK